MGQAVDEQKRQVELTKEALASDLDRLEARVRAELDWKARLRRDGAQVAVIVGLAVVIVGGSVALRLALRRRRGEEAVAEPHPAATFEELSQQIAELRQQLDAPTRRGGTPKAPEPLWQKVAIRAVTAAAAAGGSYAARQLMRRTVLAESSSDASHSTKS